VIGNIVGLPLQITPQRTTPAGQIKHQ
jgi:hypothetical protein